MTTPAWPTELAGRLDKLKLASEALRDNPLGDPYERPLWVYTPPGYDDRPEQRYPVVYALQGYTGAVTMWGNHSAFRPSYPQLADAAFARGDCPPAIVVYVDAWTRYGGSQYVDSPGTGNYHTYLCDEVVPYVDAAYRTLAAPENRGVQGKSSGGFGAMITPMLRPDLFGALATHAGDSLYEHLYLPEFAKAVRLLRNHNADIQRWWSDFQNRVAFTKEGDSALLMLLGCTAAFSARPDGTPELPFDPRTGVLRPDVWARWLDWDPVRMVADRAEALRGLRGVWIDAGTRDEWFLDLGAEAFRDALLAVDVPAHKIHFELFDATHMAIEYRYPMSLAFLAAALSPGSATPVQTAGEAPS